MNKARRTRLAEALDLLDRAKSIIEECAQEERECFDNLSEGLQGAERGQKMDEAANALEGANDALDEMIGNINTAVEE